MKASTCSASESGNIEAEGIKKWTDKFCDFVTCKQGYLWGGYVQNFMNKAFANYVGEKTETEGAWYNPDVKRLGSGKTISDYMNPQTNLITATLFVCVPGIIYGLDKYRQIKCLYADCLINAVGRDGMPVTACEDEKAYATCKYILGEVFAVIPYTAVFDHFMGLIKNALSNPFAILGLAFSIACWYGCRTIGDAGWVYYGCRGARLFSLVGDAAENVRNIVDEGFKVRTDYCERVEDFEEDEDEEPKQAVSEGTKSSGLDAKAKKEGAQ